MSARHNVYLLGTTQNAAEILRIVSKSIEVRGVICLSRREAGQAISGYTYMPEEVPDGGVRFITVDSYNLSAQKDRQALLAEDIDVMLVCGWQRLVPAWLLKHVSVCSLGIHGSPWGIAGGRGRSPQNWALLLGEKNFSLSLFMLEEGVDDGDIVAKRKFTYDFTDDIYTSYQKTALLTAEMFLEFMRELRAGRTARTKQPQEAFYLPQRLPEDGMIDWRCSSLAIYNLVRGLTAPYPGAFTQLDGKRITILKAGLFTFEGGPQAVPGQILHVFDNGDFVVKTGDSAIIASKALGNLEAIHNGKIFESADIHKQMESIIQRHNVKNPGRAIAPAILGYASAARRV